MWIRRYCFIFVALCVIGLGCSTELNAVDPPSAKAGSLDSSAVTCSVQEDCSQGYVCLGGLCVIDSVTFGTLAGTVEIPPGTDTERLPDIFLVIGSIPSEGRGEIPDLSKSRVILGETGDNGRGIWATPVTKNVEVDREKDAGTVSFSWVPELDEEDVSLSDSDVAASLADLRTNFAALCDSSDHEPTRVSVLPFWKRHLHGGVSGWSAPDTYLSSIEDHQFGWHLLDVDTSPVHKFFDADWYQSLTSGSFSMPSLAEATFVGFRCDRYVDSDSRETTMLAMVYEMPLSNGTNNGGSDMVDAKLTLAVYPDYLRDPGYPLVQYDDQNEGLASLANGPGN